MLKRISFKMKLIVMTACSMVSFLVMSAMFAFAFSYIKDLNQGKELINRLDLKILELRKNENDFLTKKDLKYEKTFQNVYDEMTVLVAELSPLLNSLQIDAGQIKTYGSFLADYKNKFSQIVTLEQEIGLDENSGWQGDLSNNIHKIETILQQNYDYRLKYLILQLRKEEKDFLLQNNTEYLNNFNNTYNSFANHLAFNQTLNTSQKLEISGQLEKYKEGFQELIARYRKKGLTENEGLGGEMITLIHQAENLMRAIKSETESAIEQKESNLTRLTAAVLIILLLIILAVSILLITKITSAVGRFIYDLSSSADQLAAASDEISEGSQQLSQGATQQAASQQEMSSVMEQIAAQSKDTSNNAGNSAAIMKEIGEMATQSIRNAKNAADISDQARISAEKGTETMSKILSAMNDINETSNKASEIVEVITEITQQTKMLATNAAIEAARAGALGKGFAVVADEVSKLAENSKTAAKEVTILIKNSVQKTQIGNNYVEEGGMVLVNILENSIKVAKLVKEISDFSETQASKTNNAMQQVENIKSASNEQATAVDEVTRTLTELDKVTQANAANSEESASASVELASQADSLKDLVKEIATHFGIKTKSVTEHEKKELPQTFVTRKTELTSPLESKAEVIPLKSQKQLDNSINPTQAIPMRDDFKEF